MKYYRTVLIYLLVLSVVRILNGNTCGTLSINPSTTAEGNAVQMQLITYPANGSIPTEWRQETKQRLCSYTDCLSNRYKLSRNAHVYTLRIENVVLADAGTYRVGCQNDSWSNQANLFITEVTTSARNKQEIPRNKTSSESTNEDRSMTNSATAKVKSETVKTEVIDKASASNERELHQKTISTESTNEYHSSMTNSATAKVESKSVKTEVSDSATENKDSTLEDMGQVTTIVVAGGAALVLMLTVIVVVIICKKQKEDDNHRASQKSGRTQNLGGTDGQDNSLPNDSGQPNSRKQSERVTSAVQHEAEHNPDALYDQQASSSAVEQINSEYATVVPKKDRIYSTQQKESTKVTVKEEEGTPEYSTVVKNRQPGCSAEQYTQGSKDKNELSLVYADLDLVSRSQSEATSKEFKATEYVSIDFQKTTTLKSQQKQLWDPLIFLKKD